MKKVIIIGFMLIALTLGQNCLSKNCVSFTVSDGTGCAWMCDFCASVLNTNNYYFTTPVCAYQPGGCVGNPIAGVSYTCCSA